jgi:hypothetical protein
MRIGRAIQFASSVPPHPQPSPLGRGNQLRSPKKIFAKLDDLEMLHCKGLLKRRTSAAASAPKFYSWLLRLCVETARHSEYSRSLKYAAEIFGPAEIRARLVLWI